MFRIKFLLSKVSFNCSRTLISIICDHNSFSYELLLNDKNFKLRNQILIIIRRLRFKAKIWHIILTQIAFDLS